MDLKSIIKEQRQELEKIEKEERIIAREKFKEAKSYLKYPNILIVTGIRRCGKSIFSYLLEKNSKFAYINFDDERLAGINAGELDKILEAFYELYGNIEYIVLDEVQNIRGWELFANRLRRTKKVIITGSNSSLLSGELSSHLTGRHLDVVLFPFSFGEFLDFKEFKTEKAYTTGEKAQLMNLLTEYLKNGGLPEVYKFGKPIISRIYEDILTKDIILRHKIKKITELKKLASYLITNSTEEFSYSKLSHVLGIKHVSTISNWISYLEDTFLIFKLERFNFKLKQQIIAPKKSYCIDTGIIDSIGFSFSENKGKIIENAVAVELLRRSSSATNSGVYYWKDPLQHEVDFVVRKEKKVMQLIQVTLVKNKEEIREREVKALLKASKELRCSNLLVITWDFESEENIEGKKVSFIPLWKWLLQ